MVSCLFTAALALATTASAHYSLNYPFWRGDALGLSSSNTSISEWNYPCAGFSQELSGNNRTEWPLDGGSVSIKGSHPWAFTYVNLGLGATVNSFNITLVDGFNQTGNGSFCIPKARYNSSTAGALPVKDGDLASIQVIQISHSGGALYTCADIVFRSNATLLGSDRCVNATGVGGVRLQNVGPSIISSNGTTSNGTTGTVSAASSTTSTSGAKAKEIVLGAVVGGLAVAFAGLL